MTPIIIDNDQRLALTKSDDTKERMQAIFDYACDQFASMTARSERGGRCLYITRDGRKQITNQCILGRCFTEAEIKPIEQYQIAQKYSPGVMQLGAKGLLPDRFFDIRDFLSELQAVHDGSYFWKNTEDGQRFTGWDSMIEVAKDYGLNERRAFDYQQAQLVTA